jgi:membrane glycosyltransferase
VNLNREAAVERLLTDPVFVVFTSMTIISVVASIGHYWSKARRDEAEAALKQEMLRRGLSADDIVKVIQATRGGAQKDPNECVEAHDRA